ncbi:hyaluronidase PH-20-like [Solea solea]|uniref:hyaluronidase PH-20-like n=1 Tax=Solea solea TaxID=90069 RepID=UPI00272D1919|nr:hyaluronidase PH-20-like [Solea solea]
MVSITQRSRSCVLLPTHSVIPPRPLFLFAVVTTLVWPVGAVTDLKDKSTSAAMPLTDQTPHRAAHQTSTKSVSHPVSHACLLQQIKHFPKSRPDLCKHLTLKTVASPPQKHLRSHLSKAPLPPHSAKPPKPRSATSSLLSKHSPLSNSSLELLTSSFLKTVETKPSPVPLLKPSTDRTSARQPGLLQSLPQTVAPLFEHHPFIVTWNIPDLVCNKYNISLDTSLFKGVATPAKVPGQFLSLFYLDRLGFYPHVDLARGKQFYGGVPQKGNLKASVNKARADINYYIPSKTTPGLAVIDWEEWRPLWDRNWGSKRIYQTLSVARVLKSNGSLTLQQATEQAKQQFQLAARGLMSGMLAVGRDMRPNYLWGFYLFPSCYNYGWMEPHYTGRCSKEVRRQNDELLWLWESSTALYPSVYLQVSLADNPRAALMVRNRVREALRVSTLPRRGGSAPVFVYTRPVFVDQNRRFLSQGDLVHTVGESAAVGAAGAVLWGASADYDDQASCKALSSYLSSTLNPYIANVSMAAQLCSNFLCRGNGRCVRKNYNSSHYLHLNPDSFRLMRVQGRYLVLGRPTFADLKTLRRRFTCQCYKGTDCTPRTHRELIKALMYSVKKGFHQKVRSLNKADNVEMKV